MWYIVLSVFCSVSVGVLLKIAKRKDINIFQLICWNYVTALFLSFFIFKPQLDSSVLPFELIASLSILLPIVFFFQNNSIKYIGIVKTDIAQRLSLFIPLIAAYFIFGEIFNSLNFFGLVLGFTAIFFTLNKKSSLDTKRSYWYFPLLVLFGFGIIDTLLKKVASLNLISFTSLLFYIFSGALIISLLILFFKVVIQKELIKLTNSYWGIGVGILNFCNILFYLKAHKALHNNPSTVFAAMNMGVIILGSIVGIVFFKEKLSKLNYFGIFLAIISIVCITFSQVKSN